MEQSDGIIDNAMNGGGDGGWRNLDIPAVDEDGYSADRLAQIRAALTQQKQASLDQIAQNGWLPVWPGNAPETGVDVPVAGGLTPEPVNPATGVQGPYATGSGQTQQPGFPGTFGGGAAAPAVLLSQPPQSGGVQPSGDGPNLYTVQKGDNLSRISTSQYGLQNIYAGMAAMRQANPGLSYDALGNPIMPLGQTLQIPILPADPAALAALDRQGRKMTGGIAAAQAALYLAQEYMSDNGTQAERDADPNYQKALAGQQQTQAMLASLHPRPSDQYMPPTPLSGYVAGYGYATLVGGPSVIASKMTGNPDYENSAFNTASEFMQHGLRAPDLYNATLVAPADVLPYLPSSSKYIGGGGSLTLDRNGTWYIGPAAAVGIPGARGLSITAGWMNQPETPSPAEIRNNAAGKSYSVGGGNIIGAAESYTPGGGTVTHIGFFTPGISGQTSYSYQLNHKSEEQVP